MSYFLKVASSRFAMAALLAGSSLINSISAQAADVVTNVTNYGLVTLPYTAGFGRAEAASTNSFVNDYAFAIGTTGSFSSAVVSIDLFNILQVTDLSISLIQGAFWTGAVPSPLSSGDRATRLANTLAFDNTGVINITPFTLAPGNYFLQVRGLASGSAGGSYGGNLNIAAVPEPSGMLLALAGAGFLAFALRRTVG